MTSLDKAVIGYAGGAEIDPTWRFRYRLWRRWNGSNRTVGFVMLNPSTANADLDDPTIRRCVGYARAWGFGRLEVANLFAWRGADPRLIPADGIGPENDAALLDLATRCDLVVAAWGNDPRRFVSDRALAVEDALAHATLHGLAVCRSGRPKHPLYQPARLHPTPLADLRRLFAGAGR